MTTPKPSLALGALALVFTLAGCGGNSSTPSGGSEMAQLGGDETRGTQKVTIKTASPDEVVLFQDGNGPWTQLTAVSTQTFRGLVHDPQGRYGVAVATPFAESSDVYQCTTGEATLLDLRPIREAGNRKVSGNIVGYNPGTQQMMLKARGPMWFFAPTTGSYGIEFQPTGDFFAGLYAKDEFYTLADALQPAKYVLRRNLTGNTRINLNLAGADFLPMQQKTVDCSALTAPIANGMVMLHLANSTVTPIPTQLGASSVSFMSPDFGQLVANDSIRVSLETAGWPKRRSIVENYNPGAGISVVDFPPALTADAVTDPSGWKVNFTPDSAFSFYHMRMMGQRTVVAHVSQGWMQSGGLTSYTKPTQVGTFQAFKKSFAGTTSSMRFYAAKTGGPLGRAMVIFNNGQDPIDSYAWDTTTLPGPNVYLQFSQTNDNL